MPARPALLILGALVLAGCATPYQPRGFTGGYSDRRIDSNTFHVSFRGNAATSRQAVETASLRRCAELAVQSGFDSFTIVGGNTDVSGLSLAMPGSYPSTTVGGATAVGGSVIGSATTTGTYIPGPVVPIRTYESVLVCRGFKGDAPGSFNAHSVLAHLGQGSTTPADTAPAAALPAVACPGTSVWTGQGCITPVPSTQAAPRPPSPPTAALSPTNASGSYSGTVTGTVRGQSLTVGITFSLVQSGGELTGVWHTSAGASGTVAAVIQEGRVTDFRARQLNPCPGEFWGVALAEDGGASFGGSYAGSDCAGNLTASFRAKRQ